MEINTTTIEGMRFQINQMPTRLALKLDKKVVTLLLPIFSGITSLSLDSDLLDLDSMIKTLQASLIDMKDDEWDKFIVDMLSHVVYLEDGVEVQEMNSQIIDLKFRGKLLTIYKLWLP